MNARPDITDRLVDFCRERHISELRVQTEFGAPVEICEIWYDEGVLCFSVKADKPKDAP